MKLGVISHIKGKGSQSVVQEAKNYFDEAHHLDIKQFEVNIHKENLQVNYKGKPLDDYDCLYIRGSYKYALLNRSLTRALMHKTYLPIEPNAFTVAHNKLLTILELQRSKINVPHTYFAATSSVAKQMVKNAQYPLILKIPEGGLGKGVMVADTTAAATSMIDALELFNQPYLIQEFIETRHKDPSDLRVLVVGGKVVACMERFAAKGDIRSNLHAKGKGAQCEPSAEVEQIALKSAKLLGADICAVDILEGIRPAVVEINLSPGLEGITKYTKTNVANIIAKFLFEKAKTLAASKIVNTDIRNIVHEPISESFVSLNIVHGMIKLPKYVTDLTGFTMDDEVIINAKKGVFTVKEHAIKKHD